MHRGNNTLEAGSFWNVLYWVHNKQSSLGQSECSKDIFFFVKKMADFGPG